MFLGHKTDLQFKESKPIEVLDNKKILINDNGVYKIGSNVCPHQNSRIITTKTLDIRCQYHGWSWNIDGTPAGAGSTSLCNNIKLHLKEAYEYKGLVFEDKLDLSVLDHIDFGNLVLDEFRIDKINADPRIVMDIFLDVDHIPVVHEGVYNLLGIEGNAKVTWDYTDWGNVQTVRNGDNKIIALWIAVYPYTMIEWQDGFLFVTRCIDETKIAVWRYRDPSRPEQEYIENKNMFETAFSQDKYQAEQMVRFPSAHLEEAKEHYREWLDK